MIKYVSYIGVITFMLHYPCICLGHWGKPQIYCQVRQT